MIDASNITAQQLTEVDDRYGQTVQEYVEIIRDLQQRNKVARVKDIAKDRGVTRSSVSTAMGNLRDLGLVNHVNYGYITLTPEGEDLGAALKQRHELLCRFLRDVLGLPGELADDEACHLEHNMSLPALKALVKFVQTLERCPECSRNDFGQDLCAGVRKADCYMHEVHTRLCEKSTGHTTTQFSGADNRREA